MPGIKIITDSTADLGQKLKERYRLEVVPLMVTFDEETYGEDVYKRQLLTTGGSSEKTTVRPLSIPRLRNRCLTRCV